MTHKTSTQYNNCKSNLKKSPLHNSTRPFVLLAYLFVYLANTLNKMKPITAKRAYMMGKKALGPPMK